MIPHIKPRPSFMERHDRVLNLADVNEILQLLNSAYMQNPSEALVKAIRKLTKIRESVWAQEEIWRDDERTEAFLNFDQLPYSVRLFFVDEELR